MFHNIEKEKLERMMDQDPELRKIIQQMLENHRLALSTVSHELRNPLTLVYSSMQLIESQHPEVLTFAHWTQMMEDVNFMVDLAKEIGSLGNSDHMNMTTFSLKHLLECAVLSFAMSLEENGIELTGKIDPSIQNYLGDKIKIQEVILNLLMNAQQAVMRKYQESAPTAAKKGTILLQASRIRSGVSIQIQDDGCGIKPEDLPSIFEPFYTNKEEGTGLGLSISKKIVESHHGTLTCSSTYGKGTTFVLTL